MTAPMHASSALNNYFPIISPVGYIMVLGYMSGRLSNASTLDPPLAHQSSIYVSTLCHPAMCQPDNLGPHPLRLGNGYGGGGVGR
jgi:hypothetical protein